MKRYPRRFGRFLDQSFARFRGVAAPPDDPSWERVLERLEEEPEAASDSGHPAMDTVRRHPRSQWPAVSRLRFSPRFAVAAMLMLAVAIGGYAAYRRGFLPAVQRESSPQGVLSTTQSPAPPVKAAAETTQVTVLTPGSTKPGAAPSREEILAGVAAQIAAAQSTDAGASRPRFAAASVRPVPMSPLVSNGFKCLGVDGPLASSGLGAPAQGRCIGDVVALSELVYLAYSNVPQNILWDTYVLGMYPELNIQINAIADNPERVTKGELKLMLRSLLEDRFKARVHLETRELDGYVLTVAQSGIKFKETPRDQLSGLQNMFDNGCTGLRANPANWTRKCRMGVLAAQLTLILGYVPVADKTGLTGVYDIKLALNEIPMGGPIAMRGAGGGIPQPRQFSPPVPKAVEEQLGLRLERGKVPTEYVVVDHIEAPTEN